jgi:hypothetical protein
LKKPAKLNAVKRKGRQKAKAPGPRAKTPTVVLTGDRVGAKLKVTALYDGKVIHFDSINHDLAPQRERFVRGVVKRVPQADVAALEAELMQLIATLPVHPEAEPVAEGVPELPPPAVKVLLSYQPGPNGQKGTLKAECEGETVHLDAIDPGIAARRRQYIKDVVAKLPYLDAANAENQMVDIAEQEINRRLSASPSGGTANPAPAGRGEPQDAEGHLEQMSQDIRDESYDRKLWMKA